MLIAEYDVRMTLVAGEHKIYLLVPFLARNLIRFRSSALQLWGPRRIFFFSLFTSSNPEHEGGAFLRNVGRQ